MKKSLLLSLITILVLPLAAQDTKGHIGIAYGPSIPIGDFANHDYDYSLAGYARTGLTADIFFAYKLGKSNFGITAMFHAQAHNYNGQARLDQLDTRYPGVDWKVLSDEWSLGGYMFGGFGSFAISPKFIFEPRIMFGPLVANSPNITTIVKGPAGTLWSKASRDWDYTFTALLGTGFKYDISKKLYLTTNLDYLNAYPKFTNVEMTNSEGERIYAYWNQRMVTINWNFGIAVKI